MTATRPPTSPVVKAALVTALRARTEFAAVQVDYDDPGTALEDDWVAVGAVRGEFTKVNIVGGGGNLWLHEDYTIEVTASSFRGDDDPQGTYESCAAFVYVVVDTIRQDPSLGGLVNITICPETFEIDPAWEDDRLGRICRASLILRVKAQL